MLPQNPIILIVAPPTCLEADRTSMGIVVGPPLRQCRMLALERSPHHSQGSLPTRCRSHPCNRRPLAVMPRL
eukprot:11420969-Alexandrium_andersonii.AAC.1